MAWTGTGTKCLIGKNNSDLPLTFSGRLRIASVRWVGVDVAIALGNKAKVTATDPDTGSTTTIFGSVAQVANWIDMTPLFEDVYKDVTIETLDGGELMLYLR